jgi:hypothetical protein
MASRTSHGVMWNYPSRKKLFLLVVVVVGALTVVSIMLLLESLKTQQSPQAPLVHPIVRLMSPQNGPSSPAFFHKKSFSQSA